MICQCIWLNSLLFIIFAFYFVLRFIYILYNKGFFFVIAIVFDIYIYYHSYSFLATTILNKNRTQTNFLQKY